LTGTGMEGEETEETEGTEEAGKSDPDPFI
jgi:hypothetical protein